jgi:hypothetical protein
MSTLYASTANRIGVRRQYKPVTAMGRYAGPAETPARQGDFRTHPLPGLGAAVIPNQSTPSNPAISRRTSILLQSGANPGTQMNPSPGMFDVGPIYHTTPISFQNAAGQATSSPGAPTTSTPVAANPSAPAPTPAPQSYTDSYGNVWENSASGWVMVQPGPSTQQTTSTQISATPTSTPTTQPALVSGAASTAQAGTPVPVGWPITTPYTDSQGYIWTYAAGYGWSVTGTEAGSAAATYAGGTATPTATAGASPAGTTVSLVSGFDISDLTTWLQEATIISPVPNFFVVAGAGLAALLLLRSGKK